MRPIAALLIALTTACASAAPQISVTQVPAWNTSQALTGTVSGVTSASTTDYIVVYLNVGGQWWIKPYDNPNARTSILADDSWSANVVTGGSDATATEYVIALMPDTAGDPPTALGTSTVPAAVYTSALATLDVTRTDPDQRSITFAGYTWDVKEALTSTVGPGNNYFSTAAQDVWVDSSGLHLSVHNHDGKWWSTEVALHGSLGYGTYVFKTASRVDTLDANVTFGLFTWDNYGDETLNPAWPYREIDFEYGRWGNSGDFNNAQMVNQPYYTFGSLRRYRMDLTDAAPQLTSFFSWSAGNLFWASMKGDQSPLSFDPNTVFDQYSYATDGSRNFIVPDPGRENVRFNLWLNNANPQTGTANGQPAEVLITNFQFYPQTVASPGATPWRATLGSVPGTIEAENFDSGGPGVSFSDSDLTNQGAGTNANAFRDTDSVDLESTSDSGGGSDINDIAAGEWTQYTVSVAQHGLYQFNARVASASGGGQLQLRIDPAGANTVVGPITIGNTGGAQSWSTVTVGTNIELTAGQHVLRAESVAGNYSLNNLNSTLTQPLPITLSTFRID